MHYFKSKRAVTVLESIASVVIISIIMITSFTLIVNTRNQTIATNEELVAVEVAKRVRDQIIDQSTYTMIDEWLANDQIILSSLTSIQTDMPFLLNALTYDLGEGNYDKEVIVTFHPQTNEDSNYQMIHFTVSITYYRTRTIELEGFIYES